MGFYRAGFKFSGRTVVFCFFSSVATPSLRQLALLVFLFSYFSLVSVVLLPVYPCTSSSASKLSLRYLVSACSCSAFSYRLYFPFLSYPRFCQFFLVTFPVFLLVLSFSNLFLLFFLFLFLMLLILYFISLFFIFIAKNDVY